MKKIPTQIKCQQWVKKRMRKKFKETSPARRNGNESHEGKKKKG